MNGMLGGLPPGLQGYVLQDQMRRQNEGQQLQQLGGMLQLRNAMETAPLDKKLKEAQLAQAQGPQLEYKDLGGSIGVFDKRSGAQIGSIPKSATPDATLRQTGEQRRHETPSAGALLGAQTAGRGQEITLRGQNQPVFSEERGFVNRPYSPIPPPIQIPGAAQSPIPAATLGARPAPVAPVYDPPPLPPRAKDVEKAGELGKTMNMYVAARDGLMSGLEGSTTGPIAGRAPAFTSAQQVAEGGVAAMAPVLKQLFRVAGEGVFTDRDQQLLLDMVPTRADRPEARAEKMKNIDNIVSAKLGRSIPNQETKVINGKTYVKMNGQWFEK